MQQQVKANGITVCAESFGDSAAPPIVLVMGLGAQMTAWDDRFCTQLADRGFRVVRFDNRDIGLSTRFDAAGVPNVMALMGNIALGKPIEVPYTLRDMAADTVGVLDAFGFSRAHVVGASMGGGIVQELAIHHPERLLSMTSVMSSTGSTKVPPASPEALAVLFTPAPTDRTGYIAHAQNVARILRGPHFPEEAAGDAGRAARNFDRGINPPGVARQLAAIFASGDRTARLAAVRTPTLVIHGDADPLIRVEGGHFTAAAIPGASLHVVPKMGHSLPEAVWPKLIDLIAGHASKHTGAAR